MALFQYQERIIYIDVPLVHVVLVQMNHHWSTWVFVIAEKKWKFCKDPKVYPKVDIPATLNQNSYQCLQVHLRQRTMNVHPNKRIFAQPESQKGEHDNTKRCCWVLFRQIHRNVHLLMVGVLTHVGQPRWRLLRATRQNHKASKTNASAHPAHTVGWYLNEWTWWRKGLPGSAVHTTAGVLGSRDLLHG